MPDRFFLYIENVNDYVKIKINIFFDREIESVRKPAVLLTMMTVFGKMLNNSLIHFMACTVQNLIKALH